MVDVEAGGAAPRGSAKETSETIKNWIDILKSIAAFVLLGALLFLVSCDRESLKKIFQDIGVSKISGPGVEIAIGASDALPRTEAALKDAQSQLGRLQRQYSTAISALKQVQDELTASKAAIPAETRQEVAAVLQRAPATIRASERTAETLDQAQARTRSAIARLPGSGDSSLGYGVVFGGDKSEVGARDQLNRAKGLPGDPRLFRRQGYYRSVLVFPNRDSANAALPRIKAINSYSADAYVVTIASWCPTADLSENPVACGS